MRIIRHNGTTYVWRERDPNGLFRGQGFYYHRGAGIWAKARKSTEAKLRVR